MTEINGYITDLSLDEAINILDAVFLNPLLARGCGKTRMLHNQAMAWVKIRNNILLPTNTHDKEKEKRNDQT